MHRIGLWVFHRKAREAVSRPHIIDRNLRWWIDEELEAVERAIQYANMGRGFHDRITNADLAGRLVKRYARRFKVDISTVGGWNALCEKVLQAAHMSHDATWKALLLYGYRDKAPVDLQRSEFRASCDARHSLAILHARLDRIKDCARKRKEREELEKEKRCAICGSEQKIRKVWLHFPRAASDDVLETIRQQHGQSFVLCFKHQMEFGKLQKAAQAASDARVIVGKLKRKKRESTKDNARTDGSSVVHHGGSDQRGREGNRGPVGAECGNADHRSSAGGNPSAGAGVCHQSEDFARVLADGAGMA
jgi:hypothetical protein